ncbi:hypothetical protein ACIQUB_30220 [Rhizobium sp. NPDC090275]|uniref:hypothetical protein n=1 Tax=Rhizobium sp. NPDC090275 TaxID=3364498 RepID=UPI00383B014A
MRTRYTFKDWRDGAAIPEDFKLCRAFGSKEERDALLLALLPGKARTSPLSWEHEDMRVYGWRVLPYGFGTDDEGNTILFDREYRGIASITTLGTVRVFALDWKQIKVKRAVMLYNDGSKPHEDGEARRLCLWIVQRYGLGGELRRRAALQRHGLLSCSFLNVALPSSDVFKAINRAIGSKRVLAFDVATGQTLRIRPPATAGSDWKPRPVNDADLAGVSLWLRSLGVRHSKKEVKSAVDAVGATVGVVWLPD